jgi:HEAT repeat protein
VLVSGLSVMVFLSGCGKPFSTTKTVIAETSSPPPRITIKPIKSKPNPLDLWRLPADNPIETYAALDQDSKTDAIQRLIDFVLGENGLASATFEEALNAGRLLKKLCHVGGSSVSYARLITAAKNPLTDPGAVERAIWVVAQINDKKTVLNLGEIFEKNPNPIARLAVLRTFAFLKTTEVIPLLERWDWGGMPASIQDQAVTTLNYLDNKRCLELYRRLLLDPKITISSNTRTAAVAYLGRLSESTEEVAPLLGKLLVITDDTLTISQISTQIELAPGKMHAILPFLYQAIEQGHVFAQIRATHLLARVYDDETVPWLTRRIGGVENLSEKERGRAPSLWIATFKTLVDLAVPPSDLIPNLVSAFSALLTHATRVNYQAAVTGLERARAVLSPRNQDVFDDMFNATYPLVPRYKDACTAVAALAVRINEWLSPHNIETPELWNEEGYPKTPWAFAIKTLSSTFLFKASPYSAPAKQLSEMLIHEWAAPHAPPPRFSPPPTAFDGETILKVAEETQPYLNANQLSEIRKLVQTTYNVLPTAQFPRDSASLYGEQFYALALREAKNEFPELTSDEERYRLDELLAESEQRLVGYLEISQGALLGIQGSLFNMFAYSSTVLASAAPEKAAVERLEAILLAHPGPLNIPYNPRLPNEESSAGQLPANPRGSAARAVTFNLALLLKKPTGAGIEQRKANALAAIKNYAKHAIYLLLHVNRNYTHYPELESNDAYDGIAPYFFHPSAIFAGAAIPLLLEKFKWSADQVQELDDSRKWLLKIYLSAFGPDGLAIPLGESTYPSSPAYANPLLGLALIPFIDRCEGQKVPKSYGVLSNYVDSARPTRVGKI